MFPDVHGEFAVRRAFAGVDHARFLEHGNMRFLSLGPGNEQILRTLDVLLKALLFSLTGKVPGGAWSCG